MRTELERCHSLTTSIWLVGCKCVHERRRRIVTNEDIFCNLSAIRQGFAILLDVLDGLEQTAKGSTRPIIGKMKQQSYVESSRLSAMYVAVPKSRRFERQDANALSRLSRSAVRSMSCKVYCRICRLLLRFSLRLFLFQLFGILYRKLFGEASSLP